MIAMQLVGTFHGQPLPLCPALAVLLSLLGLPLLPSSSRPALTTLPVALFCCLLTCRTPVAGNPEPFRAASQYISGLGSMYGAGNGSNGKASKSGTLAPFVEESPILRWLLHPHLPCVL
jgi:hypothetical protein